MRPRAVHHVATFTAPSHLAGEYSLVAAPYSCRLCCRSRTMVELRRALQENAIVREPLLNTRYEEQQVGCC